MKLDSFILWIIFYIVFLPLLFSCVLQFLISLFSISNIDIMLKVFFPFFYFTHISQSFSNLYTRT